MKRTLFAALTGALLLGGCDSGETEHAAAECAGATVGREWTFLGVRGDRIGTVQSLAVDPLDPDVLLAGTASNFSESIPKEIYRSADGGTTWTLVYRGITELGAVQQILHDPRDPNVVYAVPDRLLKSTDGGRTWAPSSAGVAVSLESRVQIVVFDPIVPGRIYLATTGPGAGAFYRSDDGAATWTRPSTGTCQGERGVYCALAGGPASLAVAATGRIYAGVNFTGSVLTSDDSGATWAFSIDGDEGQGGVISPLLVDQREPATVYGLPRASASAPSSFIETRDGGASWTVADAGLPVPLGPHTLVQSPVDGSLFLAGGRRLEEGSVWRRVAGETAWTDVGPDTVLTVFSGLAISPVRDLLYGGGQGVWSRLLPHGTATEVEPCVE